MITNHTFKMLTVAAFVVYNVASVGFAYRAGQQSVNSKYLTELNNSILLSLEQEKKAMVLYETLANDYSDAQIKHSKALNKINQEISDYVQSTTDTCRISERGLQLINALIETANADIYPTSD